MSFFLIGDTLVEGHFSSQALSITSMLTTFHKLPTCELFSKKKKKKKTYVVELADFDQLKFLKFSFIFLVFVC